LTFFVFVIGHFSAELHTLSKTVGGGAARVFFAALYYLLPNLSNYAYITAASHGRTPTANEFFGAVLYGIVYIVVLLSASTLVFKRRNFK
jgi:ABC-type transport system involved in multi-copper enzyme maturation permease subunit